MPCILALSFARMLYFGNNFSALFVKVYLAVGGTVAKNGAVLIFKGIDENKVKELMETLPLYKLKKSIEYFNLIQQF